MKKVLLIFLVVLVVLVGGLFIFVSATWDKTFDAPLPSLAATTDSAYIARGEHLVYGPAHCVDCHLSLEKVNEVGRGAKVPLSGGSGFDIPPGIFRTPNLTPDPETGIGNISDAQIARALRYSVNHNGKFMAPFMPFQNLSDDDVIAILSFLRSQPPVKNKVEPDTYRFLGKALLSLSVLKPRGPSGTPPEYVKEDSEVGYGKYLANSVGNCVGCHTNTDLKSGKYIGPEFAGGFLFAPEASTGGYAFVSPNLTPDKGSGIMAAWDETTFMNRLHGGRVYKYSPMPWEAFKRMNDTELKALYKYLNSLDPVDYKIDKVVFQPGEELPK